MATYLEVADMERNQDLLDRVKVACWVQADTIRTEDVGTANHANRLIWAAEVLKDGQVWASRMLKGVLAANIDATVNQIQNATDTAILTNVAALVDVFADGTKE